MIKLKKKKKFLKCKNLDSHVLICQLREDPSADVSGRFFGKGSLLDLFLHFGYFIVDGQLLTVHIKEPRVKLDELDEHIRLRIGMTEVGRVIPTALHRHEGGSPQGGQVADGHEIFFAFVLHGVQVTEQLPQGHPIHVRERLQEPLVHFQLALLSHVGCQAIDPLRVELVGQQRLREGPEETF